MSQNQIPMSQSQFPMSDRTRLTKVGQQQVYSLKDVVNKPDFLLTWLVPFVIFLVTTLVYTYTFLGAPAVCIFITVLGSMLGIGIVAASMKYKRAQMLLPLGIAIIPASVIGTVLGLYVYDTAAIFPSFYANARTYTNVVPSQPSAAVSDAGKLQFSAETFVSAAESVSYVTEDGTSYCVAPVRDGSGLMRIEYWAAGIGCCGERADFYCDDSAVGGAHSGIVVFDNNGYFESGRFDLYARARRKAEAEFGLQSVADPIYVRWVRADNLDMLAHHYRNRAAILIVVFTFVYLLLSAALSYALFVTRKPAQA